MKGLKRTYYIATADSDGVSLAVYKLGRFTKKEAEVHVHELNDKYPLLFIVFTALFGVVEFAKNKVQYNVKDIADKIESIAGHVVAKGGGEMVN